MAAITRISTRIGRLLPTRSISLLLQNRQKLDLGLCRKVPVSYLSAIVRKFAIALLRVGRLRVAYTFFQRGPDVSF
jgi:hypothetical protein